MLGAPAGRMTPQRGADKEWLEKLPRYNAANRKTAYNAFLLMEQERE